MHFKSNHSQISLIGGILATLIIAGISIYLQRRSVYVYIVSFGFVFFLIKIHSGKVASKITLRGKELTVEFYEWFFSKKIDAFNIDELIVEKIYVSHTRSTVNYKYAFKHNKKEVFNLFNKYGLWSSDAIERIVQIVTGPSPHAQ